MPSPLDQFTLIPINTPEALAHMIQHLWDIGEFAFDFETRSEDFAKYPEGALRKMTMLCDLFSCATPDGKAYVVPTGMVTVPVLDERFFMDSIKEIMESTNVKKFAWNFNYDGAVFANYSVWVRDVEDVMVKAHLLDENLGAGLKERCKEVGIELRRYDFKVYWKARDAYLKGAVDKKGKPKVTLADLQPMEQEYINYSGEDSIATMVLNPFYDDRLNKEPRLKEYFYKLLRPAGRTLFNMERRGMPLDRVYLRTVAATCREIRDQAEIEVYKQAGQHFNLGSTKDLGRVLYQDLGYPVYKTTEKGANSTDAGTLEQLASNGFKIAEYILRWREVEKLYGTYLAEDGGLMEACYPWGAIHSSLNLCGTDTGRLSSSGPNLQQVPRDPPKGSRIPSVRAGFIARKGYRLCGGDFSQIELRIMAHNSGDKSMVEEYCKDAEMWTALNEGRSIKGMSKSDIHQRTADACHCDRNPTAKNINFGNCLAEGTPVLTDSGWKSIETVGVHDRVWDGVEWVSHAGAVCTGVKDVIDCQGVWLTLDHEVLTTEGWIQACQYARSTPSRPLGQYLENGQLCIFCGGQKEESQKCPSGASADTKSCSPAVTLATSQAEKALRASRAGPQQPLAPSRTNTDTPTSSQTALYGVAGLAATSACSAGATIQPIPSTSIMVEGESQSATPYRTGSASSHTSRHCPGGTPIRDNSTELITTRDTSKEICGSALHRTTLETQPAPSELRTTGKLCAPQISGVNTVAGTENRVLSHESSDSASPSGRSSQSSPSVEVRTVRVWDIVDAGPRHRFQAGSLIVHNCYGAGAKKLAMMLTSVNFQNCLTNGIPFDPLRDVVTPELAQEFQTLFFNQYPGIPAYQQYISEKARKQHYVETRFGRRRRLPDVLSGDKWLVLAACRQAVNFTVQGAVAEIMLLSMARAENAIDNPHGRALQKLGFRLLMQIHDEIIGECPDNDQVVQDVQHHLAQIFQNPLPSTDAYPFSGFRVPLLFEAKAGESWSSIH